MARIAAVLLPHLPCAAEALRDAGLAGRPLVIGDGNQPKTVLDCSPEALTAGVRPGMLIRQAMSRCPEAAFLPPDPAYYRDLWDSILTALDEISPEVEDARLGRAYVNLVGLEPHYADDLALGEAILEAVRRSLSRHSEAPSHRHDSSSARSGEARISHRHSETPSHCHSEAPAEESRRNNGRLRDSTAFAPDDTKSRREGLDASLPASPRHSEAPSHCHSEAPAEESRRNNGRLRDSTAFAPDDTKGHREGLDASLPASLSMTVSDTLFPVPCSLGVAGARFTAFAAAVVSAPGEVTVVPPGRDAAFLAPLDVSLLPVSPETVGRLGLLGIESIGEVAAISRGALETQFGREGGRLWELGNGEDAEALRPRKRVEVIEERLAFEAPVAGIDVIVAGARQLLSRLRLPLRGRAARELALRAELSTGRSWEKRVVFREAVSESARLEFILKSAIAASPPPAPVRGMALRLAGLTGETGKQLSFGDKSRLQRQLEEVVRQLKARYGFSPVYRCVDVEPWSVIPEERQVLVESDA